MAKKPSEENEPNRPKDSEDGSLDEPLLEGPIAGELEPSESGELEGDISHEVSLEQTMGDFAEVIGEEDSVVEDVLDNEPKEQADELGEIPDEVLDEEPDIEPDGALVEVLDEGIDEALDEEPEIEAESTIEVEPSPYFPRGIYEDAWSVEAYYGRERPSDMDQTHDHSRKQMTAPGKKRLGILLAAIALLLALSLIFLVITGRMTLPF